ncbi:MAG: hypothetical protein JST53_00870 [Actinobacteria bacterium]|nr:hypothetical protein [Actinomycetota bacterium]
MPRRKPAPPPGRQAPTNEPLPRWVEGMIARGKLTEAEYRQRVAPREVKWRERLERRVPPAVEAEGPAAVEEWVEEWLVKDPRYLLRDDLGPRAPLP